MSGEGRPGPRAAAWLAALGPLIGLVFVWLLFAALAGRSFVTWDNQRLMLMQTAVVGTAAVGATLIIVSGGIDLSVGSTIALGTMVVALCLRAGAPPLAAALAGVGAAVACGTAIGAMIVGRTGAAAAAVLGAILAAWCWRPFGAPAAVAAGLAAGGAVAVPAELLLRRLALSPFVVTLGMWGAVRGLAKGLGDNQPVYPDGPTWLDGLMARSTGGGLGGLLPPGAWAFLGLALLMGGVLRFTTFGRHVFAVGSSELTARLCGVSVERTRFLVYLIGIGCAGLAAVLQFSYLSMGDPTTATGYELRVIAAVVIGGASLSGGEGSIRGTIVGALIMTAVDNGCTKMGLDNWVQEMVAGAIIVVAVALDQLRQRRAA